MTTTASAPVRRATDVAALGTVLGVWAHPDDEAYLSGGLMALARDAGQRVVCLTATRGELGTTDPWLWPPHQLAVERTLELGRCLDILGRPEHRWLDFADGRCAAADPEPVVRRLAALLDDVRPDTVLTFGPDGLTGHADHQAVSRWTTAAFRRAARPGARLLYARPSDRWVGALGGGERPAGRLPARVPGGRGGRPAGRGPRADRQHAGPQGSGAARADHPDRGGRRGPRGWTATRPGWPPSRSSRPTE